MQNIGNETSKEETFRLFWTFLQIKICSCIEKLLQIRCDMIYLLTAIGVTPGSSSAVQIYTQAIHRTTHRHRIQRTHSECVPCYTEHGLREHSSACQ
jgi:hypothetical protein